MTALGRNTRGPGGLLKNVLVGAALLLEPDTLSSHTPNTTTVVFQKEIVHIFQRKCFQCHTENNLSMPLTTWLVAPRVPM